MDESLFDNLSITEKAHFVHENGQFIEAQDFYSFFILVYLLNQKHIKLFYDFSGLLVSVESHTEEETPRLNFLSDQLESTIGLEN